MKTKTFGSHLRAIRLGFHEVPYYGYVRIRAGGPPWVIDFCPFGELAPRASYGGEHVIWWGGHDESEWISRLKEAFRGDKATQEPPEKACTLLLDDDGNVVEEKA